MAMDILLDEIRDVNFLTLCCDASNKGNCKILPVMVRYFSHRTGSQTKLIEVFELENETGETLFTKLKSVGEKYEIWPKVKAFSADNAGENFGGLTRGGEKNVFNRLQKEFDNQLLGIGCPSHLAHKSIEKSTDQFQDFFDIEAIVVNIYNHFKSSTTRHMRLQRLINGNDDVQLLGYSNTRFIGFGGCTDRIIENFVALQTYFETETDVPVALSRFFDHPLAKLLLIFVRDQCKYFESLIRSLEGTHVSGYEAAQKIFNFCASIRQRMEEKFTSIHFQRELDNLEERHLPFTDTILKKVGKRNVAEQIRIDTEYIEEMVQRFQSNVLKNVIMFFYK